MNGRRPAFASTAVLAAFALLAAGCDGSPATAPPGGGGQVSLSLTAEGAAAGPDAGTSTSPSFAVTQSDGEGNELVLDSVKMVLREIELERQFDDDCPDGPDDDACEKFEAGIRLLDVPLDGSTRQVVTVDVPPDTYDELEFEIHKPDDDEQEGRDFIESNPAFADASIRVRGTYNGEPFTFREDLNEDQETRLDPPLVIEEGGDPVDVTLRVDVRTWFTRDGSADGALVDPATAGEDGSGENENLVEDNIENSIEAFGEG